jgi:acetyltransferase-like isoleucine patch superfamily enzyme
LRHPKKIKIGDNVVIDDNCVLDAKGQSNQGINIGSGVFLGRNTILNCKNGNINIDDNANFGFNCHIFAAGNVNVGKNALIAAYTYFVGGDHTFAQTDVAPLFQPRTAKGINIGDNIWIGAGVRILDGISVGRDVIIGANAVVNKDIPDFAIAVGIPAKIIKSRKENS